MPIQVDRCVCVGVSFVSLLEEARRSGMTYEVLTRKTGACVQCGLCGPYVKKMLETGQVIFYEILPVDEGESDG